MLRVQCILALFFAGMIFVQYATIGGIVRGPAGAIVARASVEFRNQETGVRERTTTNREGTYARANLASGMYQAAGVANGFKTLTRHGIRPEDFQKTRLDLTLEPGSTHKHTSAKEMANEGKRTDAHSTRFPQ